MGKIEKNKAALLLWGLVLCAAVAMMLLQWGRKQPEKAPSVTGPATVQTVPAETEAPEPPESTAAAVNMEAVSFPAELAQGGLVVESLFSFEGFNPDCDNLEGSDIAAIQIRNGSDRYLKSAAVTAAMSDGTQITFSVSELPPGKALLAFAVDNARLTDGLECVAIDAAAEFEAPAVPEGIGISVEGMTVTLTNETRMEMTHIEVFCHGVFGETYYGGVSYGHTIGKLAPGESASFDVTQCVLAMVEVVRVAVNSDR